MPIQLSSLFCEGAYLVYGPLRVWTLSEFDNIKDASY